MSKLYEELGLKKNEYEDIVNILGREPNELELNMYGVMWSEHCSYKHSRALFKHFPTSNKRVLQGPGENAGIIDIGDNKAIAMKIESHNHPSAIEPYQGAATGVGGIIRDIFAMGARPIALLNSLRFGELEKSDRVKYLLDGVVDGISGYGNCMGIPTVGGETFFNKSYNGNPLVNAMCVGVIDHDKIHRSGAKGVGNSVMYIGAATGRDGVGGASFASVELTEESEEKRSAVQVGDPFMEKLLLEACLELLKTDIVVGIQDLGAAGLTSASCETATKGEGGMEINIEKIPRREKGMHPVEVMISESQERMLVIVKKGMEDEVNKIVEKWGLHSVVIGKVTDNDRLIVKDNGVIIGDMPSNSLDSSGAPKYYKEAKLPKRLKETRNFDLNKIKTPDNIEDVFMKLLRSPNIASKEWIYNQYDHMVRTSTIVSPGSDSSVIRIRGTKKAVALSTDCNSRFCYLNPREGAKASVFESARNVIASGAEPIAITDGLNFGSPENPERFYEFRESIIGIGEACRELDTPVISGNVSLYNETSDSAIYPTPIIGMVGVLDEVDKHMTMELKDEGDNIILVGITKDEIGGSEYLSRVHNLETGEIPELNIGLELKVGKSILELIKEELIKSCHDLSLGGLGIALARKAIKGRRGIDVNIETDLKVDRELFSESHSRFLITANDENLNIIKAKLNEKELPFKVIGKVNSDTFNLNVNGKNIINKSINEIESNWRGAIECIME